MVLGHAAGSGLSIGPRARLGRCSGGEIELQMAVSCAGWRPILGEWIAFDTYGGWCQGPPEVRQRVQGGVAGTPKRTSGEDIAVSL